MARLERHQASKKITFWKTAPSVDQNLKQIFTHDFSWNSLCAVMGKKKGKRKKDTRVQIDRVLYENVQPSQDISLGK